MPLVVNHGWPGSVVEQLKIIDPLTDPTAYGASAADAFHLVIPSMPGYGFSDKPTSTGWGPERMGRAWAELMTLLGYTRYVAQGGDWGAFVVDQMGLQAPEGLLAIHSNMPATVPAEVDEALQAGRPPPADLSAEERRAYEQLERTFKQVDYARFMAARPQTLYGIADSPVGLAAWLLDHNDADGQPALAVASALDRTTSTTGELTRDEILDNITLYWLTNTGVSASRLYWEYKGGFFNAKGVSIPVAVTVFPGEQYQAPRSWAEEAYPTSSTSTRSTRAVISLRGSSRSCSQRRSERLSNHCASQKIVMSTVETGRGDALAHYEARPGSVARRPAGDVAACYPGKGVSFSRDGRIRTGGLLLPKQARYQAAPRPAAPAQCTAASGGPRSRARRRR